MKRRIQLKPRSRQRGASLLLMAVIAALIVFGLFSFRSPVNFRTEQGLATADALAQAKAALIGYAATYKDTHTATDQVAGYLPCPDTDNDGNAEANCGSAGESVVGRLPWKSLGLPPLRDSDGECLWYAVAGRAKNSPKTADYNWDTPGQFIVQTPGSQILSGTTPHSRPLTVIFAAGRPLNTQTRSSGTGECSGGTAVNDFLEGLGTLGTGNTTITVGDADTIRNGTNNDRVLWISSTDIFTPIKKRSDFKTDIDAMLSDVANHLNTLTPASLPNASGSKGIAGVSTSYLGLALTPYKREFYTHWSNNLLYTKPGSTVKVNGESGCYAVLGFGGERTGAQSRDPSTLPVVESDTLSNYLEAPLLPVFQTTSDYTGNTDYFSTAASADLIRCIKGVIPPAVQASFSTNFTDFAASGGPGAAAPDAATQTLTLLDASGSTGGCFWYGNPVPLAGRTLRSYYTFQFGSSDNPGVFPDLRYGFTLQLVKGDEGNPNGCGNELNSGALGATATLAAPGTWGSRSFIVETDIHRSFTRNDPPGNHTAIMKNGSLDHAGFGDLLSSACNGTSNLCQHAAIDKFEDSPAPLAHNQRLEIITGCNNTCAICTPGLHAAPNTYAKVSVWSDCSNCSDVAINLDRITQPPTVQICSDLNPSGETAMNQVFVGFTGGFSSTFPNPVSIRDFVFRSE